MWTVREYICLLILLIVTIEDIRERAVSVYFLLIGGFGSVLYHLIEREMNIWIVLGGAAIGIIFLLISRVTKEGIGYGDSFCILILGVFLGLWDCLMVLSIAFLLLLCISIPLLWNKKMSRTCTLPFLPFLAGGYFIFVIMGGVSS